jgi:hypothetical protein
MTGTAAIAGCILVIFLAGSAFGYWLRGKAK